MVANHEDRFSCDMARKWSVAWQNQQNDLCAQRRFRSAWASTQSDQSLRCALNGKLRAQAFFMQTAKTDQTGWMPRMIWVFAGRTSFCLFVMHRLIIMYNKLPLAVRHLDGQRLIHMCTDPDSSVNGMWFISTSQSIELSEYYAPVICNHGPYGADIDISLCKAREYA